jgi:GNAT superfamily N-acetyltransferase
MRDKDSVILENLYKSILNENNIQISYINDKDKEICLKIFEQAFPQYNLKDYIKYFEDTVKWEKSLKAVVNGKTVGIYLLGDRSLEDAIKEEKAIPKEDLSDYKNKKGLEGVVLAVLPEYQKIGIGKKLKNSVENLPYDYLYGLQYKKLGNLEHWIKSRRVVAESEGPEAVYITLKDL